MSAVDLKKELEGAWGRKDAAACLSALEKMEAADFEPADLRESMVGPVVKAVRKGELESAKEEKEFEGVKSKAAALMKKWKKKVAGLGAGGDSPGAPPSAPSPTVKRKASAASAASVTQSKKQQCSNGANVGAVASSKSSVVLLTKPRVEDNDLSSIRKSIRKTFWKIFDNSPDIETLACEIEESLNRKHPADGKGKQDYKESARRLVFNLNKNAELRAQVLKGSILPSELVVMPSSEMATREQKEQKEAKEKELTEARRLDWRDKHRDEINKQCGLKDHQGMFECPKCKGNKTDFTQKQTRSADEPMTTFCHCSSCGHRWRFCQ